jgi:hypothetical protein
LTLTIRLFSTSTSKPQFWAHKTQPVSYVFPIMAPFSPDAGEWFLFIFFY